MKCGKLQITIPPDMYEKLKKISEKTGNSMAAIMRYATADYLRRMSDGVSEL